MKIPSNQTIGNNLDRNADPKYQLGCRRIQTCNLEIIEYDKIADYKNNRKTNQ